MDCFLKFLCLARFNHALGFMEEAILDAAYGKGVELVSIPDAIYGPYSSAVKSK